MNKLVAFRVWGEEKGSDGMPEIPAPPYQKLYTGYRYAGDVTPKTAAMDSHGRPIEAIVSSCLDDGNVEVTICNSGLRVSQIVPQVPEQASYSTQRKRDSAKKPTTEDRSILRKKRKDIIEMEAQIQASKEAQRFACWLRIVIV